MSHGQRIAIRLCMRTEFITQQWKVLQSSNFVSVPQKSQIQGSEVNYVSLSARTEVEHILSLSLWHA